MEITDFFNKDNVLIVNQDNDLLKTVQDLKYKLLNKTEENHADYKAAN